MGKNDKFKKKLLITVSNNFIYDRRMQRIADTLKQDFEVCIFAVNHKLPPKWQNKFDYKVHHSTIMFKSGILFYFFLNINILWNIIFNNYDIIYSVDLDTLGACSIANKLRSNILIFDSHELFTEVPELHGRNFKKAIWNRIGHLGIAQADIRITVCESVAQQLALMYNYEFSVIRNVPPLLKSDISCNFYKKSIIYQGALNVGRGLEEAIDAMVFLSDYQLIIIGDGDISNNLKSRVKDLDLQNVSFEGYILPENLSTYTRDAKIGINLLKNFSLNYYYSLANKFFDYTQAGIPTINMQFPEYELLNDYYEVSILLEHLNSNAIVEAVRLLEDEETYNRLHNNTLEAAKVWNWESEEKKLKNLYSELM